VTRSAAAGPLDRAAELLAGRIGLRVEGSMRSRVRRAIRDGAADRGESPSAYVAALLADEAAVEALVDAITVQESGFFRDAGHFEVLVRRALPALPGPGVVWSAGCGNGQEPWSLAIALEEAGAADWRVLATDVSAAALGRAAAGRYAEREIAGLSPARRDGFLARTADGTWKVGPRLRARVSFLAHNLAEEPPPVQAGACRVVFWRNVLIYLGPDATARALGALHARMPSDGWLFAGASEALTSAARLFAPRQVDGVYVYRPRTGRVARAGAGSGPTAADAGSGPEPAAAGPAGAAARLAPATPPAEPPGGPSRRFAGAAGGPARTPDRSTARHGPRPDGDAPLPEPADLVADGEAHAAAGRFADAATAFRKACFLAPDDPLPLIGLGLALERDDQAAARRAFRAARAALTRAGDDVETAGGSGAQLAELLDAKLGRDG